MGAPDSHIPIGFLLIAVFFTLGLAVVFIPILRKAMKEPPPEAPDPRHDKGEEDERPPADT